MTCVFVPGFPLEEPYCRRWEEKKVHREREGKRDSGVRRGDGGVCGRGKDSKLESEVSSSARPCVSLNIVIMKCTENRAAAINRATITILIID